MSTINSRSYYRKYFVWQQNKFRGCSIDQIAEPGTVMPLEDGLKLPYQDVDKSKYNEFSNSASNFTKPFFVSS